MSFDKAIFRKDAKILAYIFLLVMISSGHIYHYSYVTLMKTQKSLIGVVQADNRESIKASNHWPSLWVNPSQKQ